MKIESDNMILRDMIESDIEDYVSEYKKTPCKIFVPCRV